MTMAYISMKDWFTDEVPAGGWIRQEHQKTVDMDSRMERICSTAASAIRTGSAVPSFYTDDVNNGITDLCNRANLLGQSKEPVGKKFGAVRFMGYAKNKTELQQCRVFDGVGNLDCWYYIPNDTIQIYHDGCLYGINRKTPDVLTHDQYIYSLNLLLKHMDENGFLQVGERHGYFEIIYYGKDCDLKMQGWDYEKNTNAGKTVVLFEDNRFKNLSRINTWDGCMGVLNCFSREVPGIRFRYRGGEEEFARSTKHMPGDVYSFKDGSLNTALYKWYNGYYWFNNFDNPAKTNKIDDTDIQTSSEEESGGRLEDETGFVAGGTYCIESEVLDGSRVLRRTYVYKGCIGNIDGCAIDAVVMKQIGGSAARLFTLTKNDCKQLGIPYEPGLQVLPRGLAWAACESGEEDEC